MISVKSTFDEKKTTQAAAYLIKKSGNKLNYTKLVKLLYLADREAFNKWERPISGDSYVSMPKGPVLSHTYDLINYPNKSYWHTYIKKTDYDVCLCGDPEDSSLTPNEIKVLDDIYNQHKKRSWKGMISYCHKCCAEWRHPGDTSIPIRNKDILKALNKTEREIEIISEEMESINYVKRLLKAS